MSWQQLVSRGISGISALARSAAPPSPGFRILLYHAVGTKIAEDRLGIYTISPNLFERHVEALAAYSGNAFAELPDGLSGEERLRTAVTFDDGYRDNLLVAAPILLKHGIPFTVFVSTAFVQKRDSNYLSPEETKELAALPGVTIGAHGATHIPLTQCSDAELKAELEDSRHYLEDLLGKSVKTMSYPHGAVDRRVRDGVEKAGYTMAACSRFDINDADRDPLLLCRTDILGKDPVRVLKQKLHGDWDWYRYKSKDPACR
ncbi:MAG: polysaccharide deacetylase family protein [Burkholderiales bacterium]